jgi:hypothetical protein
MATREGGVRELLRTHKRYWLVPLLLVFAVFALLVVASLGSEGNFVYTLE